MSGAFTAHYPDASQGAILEALGYISLPDPESPLSAPRADVVIIGDQQITDWVQFRTGGPSGNPLYYIVGNGEPPEAGYMPTVRAIWIKGAQGLKVDTAELSTLNGNVTLSGAQPAVGASVGANRVTPKHPVKAFGSISLDGSGGHSIASGGLNVASAIVHPDGGALDPGYVEVTWVDPFDSADYSLSVCGASTALSFVLGSAGTQTDVSARLYFYDAIGNARLDPATQAFSFHFNAHGRQ